MSEATIRAHLKSIVTAVANVGVVHDYDRWSNEWPDFLAHFKTAIGGVDQIRGWSIGYNGFEAEDIEIDPNRLRSHGFSIHGYLGLEDSLATEKTAAALAETVCNAFDDSTTLHNGATYYNTSPARLLFEPRMFGGVLCHYIEIRLTVTEFRE